MLRSRLFGKSSAEAPKDAITASHKLLCRAAFFKNGTASGFWETLPLGKRVLDKLDSIVTEEMLAGVEGSQKVDMPCLMGAESWIKSGRWEAETEMFRLKDRKSKQLMLAPTHEEAFTEMVSGMFGIVPGSALPLSLFQIGKKFRDELRPRAGLLRAREFIMKDLYSFDESPAKAMVTYAKVCDAYERIFKQRLGVRVLKAQATSGAMGGNYSHEFHFESPAGEDTVLYCDKGDFCANVEATKAEANAKCTCEHCSCQGKGTLVEAKCIEVGHSFFLGTRYSDPLKARCVPVGETMPKPMQMGSYGLGMTRIVAALVEISHDAEGIVWPEAVAPYKLVVVPSPHANAEATQDIMQQVLHANVAPALRNEVLFDDRSNASFGSKMKDAKLIGAPYICTIEAEGKLDLFKRRVGGADKVNSFANWNQLTAHFN